MSEVVNVPFHGRVGRRTVVGRHVGGEFPLDDALVVLVGRREFPPLVNRFARQDAGLDVVGIGRDADGVLVGVDVDGQVAEISDGVDGRQSRIDDAAVVGRAGSKLSASSAKCRMAPIQWAVGPPSAGSGLSCCESGCCLSPFGSCSMASMVRLRSVGQPGCRGSGWQGS